jgi:hypothetical protein
MAGVPATFEAASEFVRDLVQVDVLPRIAANKFG